MKLGVNSDVNSDGTASVGIKHTLGESKVKLPHVVHKDVSKELRKAAEKVAPEKKDVEKESTDTPKSIHTKGELDLILIMIPATATAWLFFRCDVGCICHLNQVTKKKKSWIRVVNSSPCNRLNPLIEIFLIYLTLNSIQCFFCLLCSHIYELPHSLQYAFCFL